MSMHQLTRGGTPFPFHQKRYVHRSSDYRYLQIWQKSKIPFQQHYSNIHSYPSLVSQIIRTSTASKIKGYIPFIHAVPASMCVVRKVWERVAAQRRLEPPAHMIRSPLSVYATRNFAQASQTVPDREIKSAKPGILSMSYALTSGSQKLETAASWGFCNHLKDEQYFPFAEELRVSLESLGISHDSYFAKKGRYLISQYAQLEVGDFLSIHVPPDLVQRVVYDSYPYNVPTGKSAMDVALNPEDHTQNLIENPNTHMASLVLCKEVLGPDSQIVMTHANNALEVDAFCEGIQMCPMRELSAFDGLVSQTPTWREEAHNRTRESLDKELDHYADELRVFLESGDRECKKTFALTPVYRGVLCMV